MKKEFKSDCFVAKIRPETRSNIGDGWVNPPAHPKGGPRPFPEKPRGNCVRTQVKVTNKK